MDRALTLPPTHYRGRQVQCYSSSIYTFLIPGGVPTEVGMFLFVSSDCLQGYLYINKYKSCSTREHSPSFIFIILAICCTQINELFMEQCCLIWAELFGDEARGKQLRVIANGTVIAEDCKSKGNIYVFYMYIFFCKDIVIQGRDKVDYRKAAVCLS